MHGRSLRSRLPNGTNGLFYTTYLSVMHCHPLFVSVAVILTIVFAIGLAETDPADWSQGERFLLLSCISLEGYTIAVHCY
jgi:hypothetical protein